MSWLDALTGDAAVGALFSDEADLAAMLRFETALAAVQAEAGLLDAAAAAAIAAACATFRPDLDRLRTGIAQDGVVVPALLAQLRAVLGPAHAAALHLGATSQDVIDTSLVLRLDAALAILEGRLAAVSAALEALVARDGGTVLQAHTRMQVALPFTAADKIATWAAPLARHAGRLQALRPRLAVLQLGGPIGTRGELGERAEAIGAGVARRLGLAAGSPWHSQRDGLVDCGSLLSLLTGALGKIGQDVALLAQSEVAAVVLAGGGTSSAMAHKRNPVAAEVLVTLARYNAGLCGTLHGALVHENERSGQAWTLEWLTLPPLVVTAAAALRLAETLLAGLHFVRPPAL